MSSHEFSTIYGRDKHNKIKIWKAAVHIDPTGKAIATIEHGYMDGKLQTTTREYMEGKNIGKKNETSALQQCIQETERKHQDKIEKEGYTKSLDEPTTNSTPTVYPMLAHKYDPNTNSSKKKTIDFPCFVQPKLDGLRCIVYLDANQKLKFQSRTGSTFIGLAHIEKTLIPLFSQDPTLILDGELYTDQMPFEELAGLIKKKSFSDTDLYRVLKIQYHVYDMVDDNTKPFVERFEHLHRIFSQRDPTNPMDPPILQLVQTISVLNFEEFKVRFTDYVEQGYEGIMLRNIRGLYQQGHRSHDLQKYKEFLEDEYRISGFKEGDGRDKGTIIWVCLTPDGREFSVRPRGSIEKRRQLYESANVDPDRYIGQYLTVIYQELSEYGVPRFPVGKDVRVGY